MEAVTVKKVVFGGVALSLVATLLYVLLVWYYAFVKADPWGVERYLVMRGVKGANIQGDWMLRTARCAKPSKSIGEFSQYKSIFTECDEFDVSDIVNCGNLTVLNVGFHGILRNFALLKNKDIFQVVGNVDEPITDIELLTDIKEKGWIIGLRPSKNTMPQACTCPRADIYDELIFDLDMFNSLGEHDKEQLRKQQFPSINRYRRDYFWQKIDEGVFLDGAQVFRFKPFL